MISGNLNALLRKFHFLVVYQYWYTIYPYWYTLYQYWYNDTNIGINIPKSGKSILPPTCPVPPAQTMDQALVI